MSKLYWHTQQRTAELRGSERHWLSTIAGRPARAAWDFTAPDRLDRAIDACSMIPETPGADYLHKDMRAAVEQDRRHRDAVAAGQYGMHDLQPRHRLARSLDIAVAGPTAAAELHVAGHRLNALDVNLNTALVAGSDPVRLAAKITGWCEGHCWIDGPDRRWCADIIDQALAAGIYRHGLWHADHPDGPHDRWSDQGWDDVLALLRERDDAPVVLSYSVTDRFPNREIADWQPPPEVDLTPSWATADEQGRAEWAAMAEAERREYMADEAEALWDQLPAGQQWDHAMAGLRHLRPWAGLAPDTLGQVTFRAPVSVYDLLAPDRDQRVRAAFAISA